MHLTLKVHWIVLVSHSHSSAVSVLWDSLVYDSQLVRYMHFGVDFWRLFSLIFHPHSFFHSLLYWSVYSLTALYDLLLSSYSFSVCLRVRLSPVNRIHACITVALAIMPITHLRFNGLNFYPIQIALSTNCKLNLPPLPFSTLVYWS